VLHVGDRHHDAQVEPGAIGRVDDLDGTVAPEKARHLLARPRRGREPDPLRVAHRQCAETFEAEREVRAALRGGERVDLVHDDRVDALEGAALLRAQDQVEGLGRGDEDLGRIPGLGPALARWGVAGPHRHARKPKRFAARVRLVVHARERCA
jgi:hypothetical protein